MARVWGCDHWRSLGALPGEVSLGRGLGDVGDGALKGETQERGGGQAVQG